MEKFEKQENEIILLKKEIEYLKDNLSSYENQTKKILELEKKNQFQENFYIQKIQNYELKYKEQYNFINNLIENSTNKSSSIILNDNNYNYNNDIIDYQNNKKIDRNLLKFNSKNIFNKEDQYSTLTIVRNYLKNVNKFFYLLYTRKKKIVLNIKILNMKKILISII